MTDLTELADEYYEFRQSTEQVRLLWDGNTEHLEKWDDFSPEGVASRQASLRAFADRAEALVIDQTDLTALALRDTVIHSARAEVATSLWEAELRMPHPSMGLEPAMVVFLSQFRLVTREHGEAYLEKMRGIPAALAQVTATAEWAAERGRVALTSHLVQAADDIQDYLSGPAGPDEPLAGQAPPVDLPPDEAAAWKEDLLEIVRDVARPALATFGESMRGLARRGRDDDHPGLTHLEGGDEAYADAIEAHTSFRRSARDIHDLGLERVAMLEDEYRAVAGPLLETRDIAEIYTRLRDDEAQKYRDGQELVRDALAALDRASAVAPQWFRTLPTSPCVGSEASDGAMAFYSAPDVDTGKPGEFFFNTVDPTAWSRFELEAIAFHESVPGHHLQLALHAEATHLHKVHRHLWDVGYGEGWGLYSERLSDEMGLYSSDLTRVGMLAADSLRACRLVVDTGMHGLGWSRSAAIEYMRAHSPLSESQIAAEVDRYICWPAQALGYMVGRLEIQAARAEAEAAGLSVQDFHDVALGYGMVPLRTLRTLVRAAAEAAK